MSIYYLIPPSSTLVNPRGLTCVYAHHFSNFYNVVEPTASIVSHNLYAFAQLRIPTPPAREAHSDFPNPMLTHTIFYEGAVPGSYVATVIGIIPRWCLRY